MADDLESLTAERAYVAQQAALMRLQLYTVIRTHEMFGEFASTARGILMRAAGEDGKLAGGLEIHLALEGLAKQWTVTFRAWREMVEALRWNAAALPFGTLAVLHRSWISLRSVDGVDEVDAVDGRRRMEEAEPTPVFKPQVDAIVKSAGERIYSDGLNWSSRIWKLEHSSLDGMRRLVYEGVAKGDSAWRIAERLEGHLGAGRGCPRWSRSRLFKLTKKDIASGDRTGLYSGDECAGQGVAYNALRLARNEIQIAHHTATDALWSQMPWIEQERIVLSPAHPKEDICDDAVTGGTNGDGVYPKGTISLPLHPQCLCFKVAVQPSEQEFTGRLRGWMRGEGDWAEMDAYAGFVGRMTGTPVGRSGLGSVNLLVTIARRLAVWLWGDESALEDALALLG